MSGHRRIPLALVFAAVTMLCALSSQAANLLVNPSFNSAPIFTAGSWTQHASESWSMGPATAADTTSVKLIHSGADGLWMQGLYGQGQGGPQTSYASQSISCSPGNTYSADAWYSAYLICNAHIGGDDASTPPGGSGLFVNDGANEDGWIEVMFFNSGNVLLADYKSQIIDPAFLGTAATTTLPTVTNALGNVYLAWIDCPVTNQYDPTTVFPNSDPDNNVAGLTNTLAPGQFMVAPPGAVRMEFRVNLYQAGTEPGAPFWDDATLTQVGGPSPSIIGNVTPDGTSFFNGANSNFTFTVTSASAGGAPLPTNATNNIHVVVNGQDQSANLQFSGTPTSLNVKLPGLASNQLYTISVTLTNSANLPSATSVTFDTFPTNSFVVNSETYDYNGGLFIQNSVPTSAPATNSYTGLAGVLGVDLSTYAGTGTLPGNGAAELVRTDGNVAFQKANDIQGPQYKAANDPNVYPVQIAYNNPGNWENYTRVYPTGNCVVYARINSTPNGVEYLNLVTGGQGTSTQTTNNLGQFLTPSGTGANYVWIPLTDASGNLQVVNLPAGTNTLQILSGGGDNFVNFIFVPIGAPLPIIANVVPNNINPPINTNIFLNVPNITFTAISSNSTIAMKDVHIFANGTDLASKATFTGSSAGWNVSVPCPQNQLINLAITVLDAAGKSNSVSETFDTFSQTNLMIEAEDYDFNNGQFIDNPVPTGPNFLATNSYFDIAGNDGNDVAVFNVDYNGTADGNGETYYYRPTDTGIGQDFSSDFLRDKFITNSASDYIIGFWNPGQWLNYSRTFPTNKYNVFGRLAGGAGPFSNTTMKLVTAGRGTTTQTTQLIGSFADADAAGWSTWHWVPMRDTNGNIATVSLGGVQTLQITSAGGVNANYYMFVPAAAVSLSPTLSVSLSGSSVQLKFPTQSGSSYTVLYTDALVGGTWQPLSAAVPGDGSVKTVNDTISGSVAKRFYRLQIQ
ncbi:MAG TPA: hypothetical protein VG938_06740 [Verrucomicrobiae bacterium]|nr:hypothetical protein [Verrucomicrobiae bacterium]